MKKSAVIDFTGTPYAEGKKYCWSHRLDCTAILGTLGSKFGRAGGATLAIYHPRDFQRNSHRLQTNELYSIIFATSFSSNLSVPVII